MYVFIPKVIHCNHVTLSEIVRMCKILMKPNIIVMPNSMRIHIYKNLHYPV